MAHSGTIARKPGQQALCAAVWLGTPALEGFDLGDVEKPPVKGSDTTQCDSKSNCGQFTRCRVGGGESAHQVIIVPLQGHPDFPQNILCYRQVVGKHLGVPSKLTFLMRTLPERFSPTSSFADHITTEKHFIAEVGRREWGLQDQAVGWWIKGSRS